MVDRDGPSKPPPLKPTGASGPPPVPPPLPAVEREGEQQAVRQPELSPAEPPLQPEPAAGGLQAERPTRPPRRRRFRRRRPAAAGAYRPDRGRVQTVRWLAAILGLAVLFAAAPALGSLNLATAPGWARLVLLVAVLEAVYVVWMAVTPDWSTVWVVMLVFAFVSAGYGAATAMTIATPLDAPMPLGLGPLRDSAARWCGSVLLVHALGTYLAGRTSSRWHRAVELETAARGPRPHDAA